MKHKPGVSRSEKWMTEIYKICQEYSPDVKKITIVAREFTKITLIAFKLFSDISGIRIDMQSSEIQAGLSKDCNKSTMGLLQGMLKSHKEIVQRLSSLEAKNTVVRDIQIGNG